MPTDIEHLKKTKIAAPADGADDRRFLPVAGGASQPASQPDITEAVGGSGDAPAAPVDPELLQEQIVGAPKEIYDPEIPVNIYDLGLIYDIAVQPGGKVDVKMTLTSPMCPVAGTLPPEVQQRIEKLDEVSEAKVEVVWDPPWTPERMTDAAKLQLNL